MNSYLITINPSKEVTDIVDRYRNKYAKFTTYKIPPHITIYPPFYLNKISENEVLRLLAFLKKINGFCLNFNSVKYFEEGNNVAFFAPDKKSAVLLKKIFLKVVEKLRNKVKDVYDDYKLSVECFNPHLTISERILDNEFQKIKKELNKINENLVFKCEFLCLYKQEPKSRIWNKVGEIKFN